VATVDPRIRFEDVARAALDQAYTLLPEWMGGKKEGHEWKAERKANGGPGDSWTVNLNTGKWMHGAGDERGGDLISLYAALYHIDNISALPIVAAASGVNSIGVPVLPARQRERPAPVEDEDETPIEQIPDEPGPLPWSQHGVATAVYDRYGRDFIVTRFDTPSGKVFQPYRWRKGKWWCRGAPSPRRLYNIDQLTERALAPVLIVEGEKCVEALIPILETHIVVTWANGGNSVKKNRWESLNGRNVLIWPDADKAGLDAAAEIARQLKTIAKSVRVVQLPDDVPEGWDLADGITDGWDAPRILAWIRDHVVDGAREAVVPAKSIDQPIPKETAIPHIDAHEESSMIRWGDLGLDLAEGGAPHPTLANASLILQFHPRFKGRVWYDDFTRKVCHNQRGNTVNWSDEDDEDLTVFIQQSLHLPKFNLQLIRQSVRHAARCFHRNPLTDWLDSLVWDGSSVLDDWLVDCLGIDKTEYTIAVSNKWPISMVARAYRPGCKADTMPVLEGVMGTGKSSFLDILGSPWYASLPDAFGNKFMDNIRGRWLVEIPDMSGFSSRDHQHILAILTTRTDIDRIPYDKHSSEFPRSCIFAGTSETDDYLQDTLGSRRYWPLRCKDIDTDRLHGYRDRVFAEAVARFREGADYWTMPSGTKDEQQRRAPPDEWTEAILTAAEAEFAAGNAVIASRLLTRFPLEIPLGRQTPAEQRRAGKVLRRNGWEWKHTNRGGIWIKKPTE
jgi:predicted P-loop ATPase